MARWPLTDRLASRQVAATSRPARRRTHISHLQRRDHMRLPSSARRGGKGAGGYGWGKERSKSHPSQDNRKVFFHCHYRSGSKFCASAVSPGQQRYFCNHFLSQLPPACAVDWVAKVIWDRPARRAASITVITSWCRALASAWMITTESLPALAPSVRAAARMSTLRPVTGVLLTL